jgi:hypothetical protein
MIRFRFQPTFQDWFALNRILVIRQFRFLIGLSTFILALYVVYPFLLQSMGHDEGGIIGAYRKSLPALFIPGLVTLILIGTYVGVRKRWRAAEELREVRDYEIDESGVRVTGSSLSGFLDWRHFTHAELKRGYFMLRTAQNQFHYFPASVVPDQHALNELLAKKVGPKKG